MRIRAADDDHLQMQMPGGISSRTVISTDIRIVGMDTSAGPLYMYQGKSNRLLR